MWYKSDKAKSIYKAAGYSVASVLISSLAIPMLELAADSGVSWGYVVPTVNVILVVVKKAFDAARGK